MCSSKIPMGFGDWEKVKNVLKYMSLTLHKSFIEKIRSPLRLFSSNNVTLSHLKFLVLLSNFFAQFQIFNVV